VRPADAPWPQLDEASLCGLAGDIVRAIEPHTEADMAAILVNVLVGFGNLVGPDPHFRVEHDRHALRLYAVLVGDTSTGRKGQSWSTPRHMLTTVDPTWKGRITSGLSSGEGLIYNVRDDKEPDKRLLVVEEEFAQALKVMKREGNILSPIIRDAWDHGDLHPLTKTTPLRATGAHVSIIGHITRHELLRHLTETEMANGFANRFLWVAVRRSKSIPSPIGIPNDALMPLVEKLEEAVAFAQDVGELTRNSAAEFLWSAMYAGLCEGKPGLLGAVLSRAAPQVMRLACIYAVLDQSPQVRRGDLMAALALWWYVEDSAQWIFGTRLGDPVADRILAALRESGTQSETNIRDLFDRNRRGYEIDRALRLIEDLGLATPAKVETGGRPKTVWALAT
jgi:hypothetical protein